MLDLLEVHHFTGRPADPQKCACGEPINYRACGMRPDGERVCVLCLQVAAGAYP